MLFVLVLAVPALAHASLISAEPADGSVLAAVPERFSLSFNEPVGPLVLRLVSPDGSQQPLQATEKGDTLLIEPPAGFAASRPSGTYVLSWRVISTDGHPVGGSVVFSIGKPSAGGAPPVAEAVDWPLRGAIWLARLSLYCGLFFGVGGAFFGAWIAGGRAPACRFTGSMLWLGLLAAVVSVGLQGLDALALPLARIGEDNAWRAGFQTSYGTEAALAALALLAGACALKWRAYGRAFSLAGLCGCGLALAASGHAASADPQWLMRPAVLLHGVAVAFWVGSLAPLAALLLSSDEEAVPALRRFSRAIPYLLALLLAAGIALALVQMDRTPSAFLSTAYGRVLLAKLVLVAALLLLAAWNRWRLTGPVVAGAPQAGNRLRRAILMEIVLVSAILGVVALWRFTPPPRALIAASAAPVSVHLHGEKAMAEISIRPGHVGRVEVEISVLSGDFGVLVPKEVSLDFSKPEAGIEPFTRKAHLAGDVWRIDGLQLALPGRWKLEADLLVSDFDLVRLSGEIDIRP